MKYRLDYDDTRDILLVEVLGDMSPGEIREFFAAIARSLQGKPRRYLLVDVSTDSLSTTLDKEIRQAYRDCVKLTEIQRSAIVGASPVIRIMAKIILAVMGRASSAAFFPNREEANRWLTGEDAE